MATLRVAFLSALVLELSAAVATALVAVEVGLRLLYGHLGYPTALLVLLLTRGVPPVAQRERRLPRRPRTARTPPSAHCGSSTPPYLRGGQCPGDGRCCPTSVLQPVRFNAATLGYPGRPDAVLREVEPGDRSRGADHDHRSERSGEVDAAQRAAPVYRADGRTRAGRRVPLADIAADLWRRQIGWLPQRPALFPWTVAENIALGDGGIPRGPIERAAQLAGADGFIRSLPDGYDTVLDERGLRLSAGQRQKLALARLFLRDAPLLLLDEPAAHLDPASVAEVGEALALLGVGRTMLVITHRDVAASRPAGHLLVADGLVTEPTTRPGAPAAAHTGVSP